MVVVVRVVSAGPVNLAAGRDEGCRLPERLITISDDSL